MHLNNFYAPQTMNFIKTTILAFLLLGGLCHAQQRDIWSLKQCIEYALDQNLQLRNSDVQVKLSETNLKESRAARLPNLNGSMGYGVNVGRAVDPLTNDFTTTTLQNSSIGVGSSVSLYNGGIIENTIRQSELNLQADKLDLEQAKQNLVLDVTLAYLNILFNEELLHNQEERIEVTRNQLERTAKLVDAGTLARNSLLEIEAQLATDELNIVNARNNLESTHLQLMQLLYLSPTQKFGIERPDLGEPNVNQSIIRLEEIYEAAEKTQPFIRSADLRVRSATLGEKIAQGRKRPSLTLNGNVGSGHSSAARSLIGTEQGFNTIPIFIRQISDDPIAVEFPSSTPIFADSYSYFDQISDNLRGTFSLGMSVPIFNRRQIKSGEERAKLSSIQAQNTAEISRQQLQQQIQQAYLNVNNAASQYRQIKKQLEALQLAFENSEKQFNLGVINSVDYLIAKSNLDQANNDLIRSKFDYIFRSKILDFYQGKPIGF